MQSLSTEDEVQYDIAADRSMAQHMDYLHEKLRITRDVDGEKARMYKGMQTILRTHWKKNMVDLRNRSADGLGLYTKNEEVPDIHLGTVDGSVLTPIHGNAFSDALDLETSRMGIINRMMGSMQAATQYVTSRSYANFLASTDHREADDLAFLARARSGRKENGDINLRQKMGGGTNTSRRIIWPMMDASIRLYEREAGTAATPEQSEQLAKATLPIVAILAQAHINIFSIMREDLQYEGRAANSLDDSEVPPVDISKLRYSESRGHPRIELQPEVFMHVYARMLEQTRSEYYGHLVRVGCPGSSVIPVLHGWCMDVARAHLFHRSERMSIMPLKAKN